MNKLNATETSDDRDAVGHAIEDYYEGRVSGKFEVIENSEGFCAYSNGPEVYFRTIDLWTKGEQEGIKFARGRALDVGCGAGRHALHLQDLGHEVSGIDISPRAVDVCRRRGIDDVRVASFSNFQCPTKFETILLLGNNLGLIGTKNQTRPFFEKLSSLATDDAIVVASALIGDAEMKFRVWYKQFCTDWSDWLIISPELLAKDLVGSGWVISKQFASNFDATFVIERC